MLQNPTITMATTTTSTSNNSSHATLPATKSGANMMLIQKSQRDTPNVRSQLYRSSSLRSVMTSNRGYARSASINNVKEMRNNSLNGTNDSDNNKNSTTTLTRPLMNRSSSLRTLLNDSREVMVNLKGVFELLKGRNAQVPGVPDEFADAFHAVFDRSCCTSLSQSTRYPSSEGLEDMDFDDLFIDFILNFQSAFKATVKDMQLVRPPNVIKYTVRLVNHDTDVTFTSIAYIGGQHGKIVRTERQETHYAIAPLVKNLKHYFALFTGKMQHSVVSVQEFRSRFNAIHHTSLVVVEDASSSTARTMEYDQAYASAARLLENGAKIELLSVQVHQDGLEYAIRFSLASGIPLFVARCLATVENGRIVRITSFPDTTFSPTGDSLNNGHQSTSEMELFLYDEGISNSIQAMKNMKNLVSLFQGKSTTPDEFPHQFACTFEKSVEFIQADELSFTDTAPGSFDDLYEAFLQLVTSRKKVEMTSMERVSTHAIAFTIRAFNHELDSTTRFLADVGKNGKLRRIEQQGETKYSIFPLIKNFRSFMALFPCDKTQKQQQQHSQDEETTLETRLNAICDPSVVIETSLGCVGYDEIVHKVLPSWLEKGCKTTILQLKRHDNGLEYKLRQSTATHEVTTRSIALVERGKIVRIVPYREIGKPLNTKYTLQDHEFNIVYHPKMKPVNRITEQERNNAIQKMQVCFAFFGHHSAATPEEQEQVRSKRQLKAAMLDLYDPSCFEVTTTNGPVYYEWFKVCEVKMLLRGLRIDWKVINSQHPKGIFYELHFKSDHDSQKVRVLAVLRRGKVVRLEATENADYFDHLYPQSRRCSV